MTPSRLSSVLRMVANRIDNSHQPSRIAVAAELRAILANLEQMGEGDDIIHMLADPTVGIEEVGLDETIFPKLLEDIASYLKQNGAQEVDFDGSDSFYVVCQPGKKEEASKALESLKSGALGEQAAAFVGLFKEMSE